jgi:hypothetical protein
MNMTQTIKLRPDNANSVGDSEIDVDYYGEADELKKMQPSTISDQQESLEKRNGRDNELLNKMTSQEAANDNKLGNFSPISPPSLQVKKDMTETPNMNNAATLGYGANNAGAANLSNYQRSYEPPVQLVNKPYYATMGIGQTGTGSFGGDSKLMEKINYMIHLLEEQGHEKTNHITEEFILYTFLGVFIIFVVDSFSRSGKYVR